MTVACDIHPWMHGHVMIFDHPFFAVTGPDGSFEIKGVPAGDQNVVVWQEGVGYVTPGSGTRDAGQNHCRPKPPIWVTSRSIKVK